MRERGREGRGQRGGRASLPSSFLPRSSGGGRTWPSAAGGGHPPSSRGRPPWGTTTDRPSSAACSSLRSVSTVRTHSFRPQDGGRPPPQGRVPCRRGAVPGGAPRLPPHLPAELATHSLCCRSGKSHTPYSPVASDHPPRRGREATAPPCLRHPSRSGAWSRERPREGRGCSEGARGRGWAPGPWMPLGPPSQARGPVTPNGGRSGFCQVSN